MSITRETAQKLMTIIVECGNSLISTLPALEQELTPEECATPKSLPIRQTCWRSRLPYRDADCAARMMGVARPSFSIIARRQPAVGA